MPPITVQHRYADSALPLGSRTPYEIDDPYWQTNQLWTRGVITVTPDGRRHVSLGRGYTLYTFPEQDPNIEEYVSKVYERRNNGLYEYSRDKLNGVQNCVVCSTKTIKHCERCLTYYCSKVCQLEDWPQHEAQCRRIPSLVEETVNNVSSLQIGQDVDQTKTSALNAINKTVKSNDLKLRRPNTHNTMQTENSNDDTSVNINMHKSNTNVTHNSNNDIQERPQHNNINVSQTKKADQLNTSNIKEFSQQHRRYNNTNDSPDNSRKNSATSSSSAQSYHSRNCQNDLNKTSINKERNDNSNIRDRIYNNDKNVPQRNSFQNNKGSACYNRENINKSELESCSNTSVNSDLAFYKDTHLSKTKFTTVEVIIPLNNDEYWIYKLEDADARNDLMIKLQEVVKTSRNMHPIVDEVYGVMYDTIWHRARVTSLNPTKVHFIDFGNDEILEKDAPLKDIKDLIKAPKFARKIRLSQSTRKLREGEKISVKTLSVDSENTTIVELEQGQLENSPLCTTGSISNNAVKKSQKNSETSPDKSIKTSKIQIPNILDDITNSMKQKKVSEMQIAGLMQINEATQKNVYSVTLCPSDYQDKIQMIFEDLEEECKKVQTSVHFKPKADDLVCFKAPDDYWYRGYVLASPETSSNWSIFSADDAKIFSTDKVVPCPEKFLNICTFGVICEINHPTIQLKVSESYEFTAIINEKSCKQECLQIQIIDSEVIQAVVRPWKFKISPSLFELKTGSKVCLTSYRNHFCMFARSLDDAAVEYYNSIMQSVARYAQTAPSLTELPTKEKIVIAPFEDGNNYRAIILKTQNDKAMIAYIDFGNVAEIDIKDLKEMPECLSLQQSCSGKIILKDIPRDIPSNQEVDLYLRELVGNEVSLICTFEGGSAKDGVYLTTLTGESINDKINRLLIPGWKRENKSDNVCYMFNDIKAAALGSVGDTVDAVVVYMRASMIQSFMIAPFDVELLTYVFNVMPTKLKEYCEKAEYYIPRQHELCLALYEGMWYRAACIDPKESYTTAQILFLDYGNIESVEHKNIRLMPKDFVTPSAVANLCEVVNLAPVDNGNYSETVQNKLSELIQVNSQIKIKIVECVCEGQYKVELPDVRAELVKHGLV
ncbi:uncharacterized protein LOC105838453 isoform X2 [Monomorium pharaonis]|nr:uncharacterized protein LOC105838453 isoform X2 [Monomorium pharaonis]